MMLFSFPSHKNQNATNKYNINFQREGGESTKVAKEEQNLRTNIALAL